MDRRFYTLIDEATREVTRREPSYLARFPVGLPPAAEAAKIYAVHRLAADFSQAEIARALDEGFAYLCERGVMVSDGSEAPDPLGRILTDSVFDAYAAGRDALPLTPSPADGPPFSEMLSGDYAALRTADGQRYFLRRRGRRPLVLINACGIPLAVWSKFLGDPEHDFKIMVVECAGHDLLGGGLLHACDLASDGAGIVAALDHAGIESADILAWCDGGRLAIDLARRQPERIGAMVLLSVSLRGTKAVDQPVTPYEANFSKVMATVSERPGLAPMFAKMLGEQILSTDWDGFGDDIEGRVAALCRLPATEQEPFIRVPLSRDLFLLNHGKRIQSDAAYAVDDAIRALDLPMLLITGDRDHVANTMVARAALGGAAGKGIHAQIRGAGHYSFDLQYSYFRLLLNAFLADRDRPFGTARVQVEDL